MGNSNGRPVVITDEVKLEHFKLLRVVGKGAFGKVRIVERKDTGLTFALKYLRKDEIVRSENVRNIVRERRMLEHLNHPFLCNLRYSFQDYEYIYLVVDLMSGGDLRFHITRKTFTEDAIRFWVAELGCALRYIHSQGVVHRDVKPDNVLLDAYGHVHLADFNVASDFKPGKALTSKSGTLAYLAPEVYDGLGYSSGVDWWSLGVLFYECIYNKRPFEGSNHEDLANKIKAASPRYPTTNPPVSAACSSSIKSLIQRKLCDRIGANGFDKFRNHPFFQSLDFGELEKQRISPVFVPNAEKTNFDATYDLEELLLEESPLEARMKHQKPRPALRSDATPREKRQDELYRMIEQYFEPFDYTAATFKDENLFDKTTEASHEEDRTQEQPKSRVSTSSAASPTDNRNPEPPLSNQHLPSAYNHTQSSAEPNLDTMIVGSPPLATKFSIPTIRTESPPRRSLTTAQRALTASEITTMQANALVAAAAAVAAPHGNLSPNEATGIGTPQDGPPKIHTPRPTQSPRSKSVSVSHFRNMNKPAANATAARPDNDNAPSTTTTAKTPRQVLSADSGSGKGAKDRKGGFLGILGKKSGSHAGGGSGGGGGGGMLMGREKSPKRPLENGVLGKDGARVIVD